MPDGEELILTKKTDYDYIAKDKNKKWEKVLHPQNQIKDWPDYDPRTDDFYNADGGEEGGMDEETVRKLRAEIERIKKHCEEEKQTLQRTIIELEERIKNMGVPLKESKEIGTDPMEYPYLSTIIIREVPENGIIHYGVSPFERRIRIVQFDKDIADQIKKITVNECEDLIQLDLTGLTNLEKLSLKKSKWDSIKNIKERVNLKKVSVKDCVDVDMNWIENSSVQEVKII